jgi:hypothetical protein
MHNATQHLENYCFLSKSQALLALPFNKGSVQTQKKHGIRLNYI